MLNSKQNQKAPVNKVDVYISPESVITGDLQTKSNIIIDGQVNGNIVAFGNVQIGNSSTVAGSICAKNVQIAGSVNGDITADGEMLLFSSAKLVGDVKANAITIEKGASFKGNTYISAEPLEAGAKGFEQKAVPATA